ncbi:Uma2 family endonuclease [Alienimonas sp. DA493]|uniref:Uma2 family endonuclease n=1 Tax=Alienimonas sp. DA493 TaxID=3373605 RepID=UPI003753FA01
MAIPPGAMELDGFLDWVCSAGFPRGVRASLINGCLRLEPVGDHLFTHNSLKGAVFAALREYGRRTKLGRAYTDGAIYAHRPDGPANEPDATFLLYESLTSGRVRVGERREGAGGLPIVEGAADLVAECVSDSSVPKDTVELRAAYFSAGVREYWLLDGRGDDLEFALLTRTEESADWAEAEVDADGYRLSPVLGRRVKIARETDPLGDAEWDVLLDEPAAAE